jgi:hypothetical protein
MTRSPWWRRLLRWAIRLLVVAVAVRLLLALFLTQLIAFAAPWLGLQVQIRSAWLSLAGLSLRLQDVVAADAARPAAPPLLRAGEITLDLSARALLRGAFVVDVGAVAQAHAHLERDADGRLLLPSAWSASTPVAVHQPDGASAISSLRLPFQARALRLHDVVVTFVDGAASPPRTDELTLDVAVRDLGDPQADANLAVRAHAPDAMDAGWLQATLHSDERTLRLRWQADLRDVRTARLAAAVALPPALAKLTSLGATANGELRLALTAPGALDGDGNATVRLLADGQERVVAEASFGPARANTTARTLPFALRLRAPGFVDELALADAELDQRDDELGCRGSLRADGVTLGAARPWLAAHGLQWPDAGIRASAAFDVSLGASVTAALRDVRLQSGDQAITAPLVAVRDLRRDDEGLAIEAAELVGPVGAIARRADGGWSALGASFAPTAGPAAAPTPTGAAPQRPAVRVGSLRWRGADLTFTDATRSGETLRMPGADLALPDATRGAGATLRLADVDVHGDGLAFGVDAPPGRLHVRAMLADAVSSLELDATLAPGRDGIAAQATLAADGLTLRALQPWLAPLGLAPRWQGAALRLAAEARIGGADGETTVAARVGALRLVDGEQTLLQASDVAVEGLRVGRDGLVLGAWTLNSPDAAVAREPDGALVIAGVALSTNPRPQPTTAAANPTAAPTPAPTTPAATPLQLPTVALADGVLRWRDGAALERRIELAATVGAASPAADVPVRATLRAPGAVANCVIDGTVRLAQPAATLALAADGIDGAGLADLLPPSLRCELRDGAFAGSLAWTTGDGGALTVDATNVRVRDGADELLALPRLRLDVATADAEAAHVREFAVEGLRGTVRVDADGVGVAGFRTQPTARPVAAPAANGDAAADADVRVPRLRVDRATLGVERLTVARAGMAPVEVAATATLAPWDASTPDLLATPARWTVGVAAPPLLRDATVELAVAPFALQPTLDAVVRVAGADLTQLAPGGTVADAALAADVHARVNLRRRDPQRFAFGRPFGGEVAVEGFALRDAATGNVLAQADNLTAAVRAIDPRTGDVLLRSLTASGLAFDVTQTADGVQLPGLFVATTPATTTPGAATAPAGAPTAPAPEFAVEHVSIQGLRTTYRDETTSPPTVAPIADAEIDLHGVTTRALAEPRPLAFDVSLRGGDVELERRVHAGNLLAGVVGSAARAVALQGNRHALERRPMFDEIALTGRLEFAPFLRGELRGNVAAFELMGLRGLAKRASIEIADGVVDQRVQVDLRGPDGIDVKSLQVFRWLSLTEPPGGPITTYLRLPMPLPSVLFLLRNEQEEQRVPIAIHLPARGVKTSDVVDAVAEAFAKVVADAVAGSARRAAGVVTGFFDFLWPARALPAAAVGFGPGDSTPTTMAIAAIADALAGDPQLEVLLAHELGSDDLPRVRALATPPATAVAAHVAELRRERTELEARRIALVADLDALYAAGRMPEARRGQEELLAHDERLGALERTLDEALALLANDTPRAARRRDEAAARALGQARLQAVATALRRAVPGLDPERIVVRAPRGAPSGEPAVGGGVTATLRRRMAR